MSEDNMNKSQTGKEILQELNTKFAKATTGIASDHDDAYMIVTFVPQFGLISTYTDEEHLKEHIEMHMKKLFASRENIDRDLTEVGFKSGIMGLETSVFKLTFQEKYATMISDLNRILGER